MSDQERKLLKARLERARYLLHDHYCFMRTHGVEAEYEEAQRVARFLLDTYGDDAEVILSGYLVSRDEDIPSDFAQGVNPQGTKSEGTGA